MSIGILAPAVVSGLQFLRVILYFLYYDMKERRQAIKTKPHALIFLPFLIISCFVFKICVS